MKRLSFRIVDQLPNFELGNWLSKINEMCALERNCRNSVAAFCVLPNGSYTAKGIWEE